MSIGMRIWFIIGFTLLMFGMINHIISDKEEVYKKCYDRFSNEIVGEKCIEQRLVAPHYFIENILFGLFFINFFVTPLILISLQDYLDRRQK
jgi:hypothetical protein